MEGDKVWFARRKVEVPGTRDESGGHDPSGCAHDAQPLILPQNCAEFELEELGNVPYEGEDLSDTVVDGCHRRKEVHDSTRDRSRFL
jgi:hypothetical protein